MRSLRLLVFSFSLIVISVTPSFGQPKAEEPKIVASKIIAVTVYQGTALVTREAAVPEGVGLQEIIISPLPPGCQQNSLYAEGSDGLRVLTVRYRSRAISEDNREEVRKLETKMKETSRKMAQIQADQKALEDNTKLLTKLEGFTAATLNSLTEKGQLNSEKTIELVKYIQDSRAKAAKELVAMMQQMESLQEELNFNKRLLGEKSGGVVRTERDAVIVLDKTKPGAGSVRLNYLVNNATWKPQYKLRAGSRDTDKVNVEYQASMVQNTGEDWTNVSLTLSTAQPMLNASPPDLLALEVSLGNVGQIANNPAVPGAAQSPMAGYGGFGPAGRGGSLKNDELRELDSKTRELRKKAQDNLNLQNSVDAIKDANSAAALEQFRDLLVAREELGKILPPSTINDGPSVTYKVKDKISLPSRLDDQIVEINRMELTPRFYYKAIPLLTPHVYRIADLTNTSELVLLPGEATTYLGTDFVGQSQLPLIAIGKPFTVGFGADPQLQVSRKLLDRTRSVQGGNQILNFKYQILLSSYKPNAVDVQVWDRIPHTEGTATIAISLTKGEPDLSKDGLYLRDERPKNLLRWDVKIEPKQHGEKPLTINYEYKMELDRNVTIGSFVSR